MYFILSGIRNRSAQLMSDSPLCSCPTKPECHMVFGIYYLQRNWPFLDSGFMFELLRTCWFNNCIGISFKIMDRAYFMYWIKKMLIYDLVTDMTVAQVLRYLDISVFTNSCWIEGRFFRSYQSSHIMFWISSRQLLTVWQVMIWTHHWTLRSRTLPRALH